MVRIPNRVTSGRKKPTTMAIPPSRGTRRVCTLRAPGSSMASGERAAGAGERRSRIALRRAPCSDERRDDAAHGRNLAVSAIGVGILGGLTRGRGRDNDLRGEPSSLRVHSGFVMLADMWPDWCPASTLPDASGGAARRIAAETVSFCSDGAANVQVRARAGASAR